MDAEGSALTPEQACERLVRLGVRCDPTEVRIEERDGRWLVRLSGARLAWFARDDAGRRKLSKERRVLRLLAERCSFATPRVLAAEPTGELDVRAMVEGTCDPWRVYAAVRDDAGIAARIGAAVGTILAEQHTRITAADVVGLPTAVDWPGARPWIRERLPQVVDDAALIAAAEATMAAYESVPVAADDRVLVHTDLGLHNLAYDAATLEVRGVFDYEGAAWADRHHDFRDLVLDLGGEALFEAAVAAYEPRVGRAIDRGRVRLYNAACAIMFLAYRAGVKPEERSCGRTLAEDLRWTRSAIARAGV